MMSSSVYFIYAELFSAMYESVLSDFVYAVKILAKAFAHALLLWGDISLVSCVSHPHFMCTSPTPT